MCVCVLINCVALTALNVCRLLCGAALGFSMLSTDSGCCELCYSGTERVSRWCHGLCHRESGEVADNSYIYGNEACVGMGCWVGLGSVVLG